MPPSGGAIVTSSSAPTVGIVGLGYGRAHITGFQAHGCRVVALCQRDRAAAQTLATRYGVPDVFDRWEEMLDAARPDIVVIATPPHLHHAITLRALAGGAHVLCEKPLAMTAAEGRAMADAARRAGRVAMTGFNWRFPAAMRELNARVREGAVGRVFHLAGRWLGGRFADPSATATWRVDRAQAGHGAMGDAGVHLIDMIRWSFGEFRRVAALAGTAFPSRALPGAGKPADAEDHCMVLAELADGTEVTMNVSRAAHGMMEHTLEVFGERGALAYRMVREGRWWDGELRASDKGASFVPVAPREPSGLETAPPDASDIIGKATIAPLVERLLDGIRTGTTPSPSFEDGVRAQAVLDAIGESAARRAWVDIS
jgi:predicted dehydrogenase